MNTDLKDILSNSNKDIDNQKLMDYLTNELSKSASHEVEENMVNDDFLNDAVEGLQEIKNTKNMEAYVEQLNLDLQKQTVKNKKRKEKRRFKDQPYTYLTIAILLVLIVICFVAIKKHLDAKRAVNPPVAENISKPKLD
ncbi:hypothetical protein BH11BAC3_BH11BAC3_20470 [soil metagenome]